MREDAASESAHWLVNALRRGCDIRLDKEGRSFYGPLAEMRILDALGENGGALSSDRVQTAERFDLRYQGTDDKWQQACGHCSIVVWFARAIYRTPYRALCRAACPFG